MKACKRCNDSEAVAGEKYCKSCRKSVLQELKQAGYLEPTFPPKSPSEQIGRTQRDLDAIGGSAEMNSDGDD